MRQQSCHSSRVGKRLEPRKRRLRSRRKRSSGATSSDRSLRLALESLEPRHLLSADIPFASAVSIDPALRGATAVQTGDVNGDGRTDVVIVEGGKHSNGRQTFAWYEANVDGTFSKHDITANKPGPFTGDVRLADIDNDGDLDVVVPEDDHGSGSGNLYWFENAGQGQGDWQRHTIWSGLPNTYHQGEMEVADMDGDGKLDVVVRHLGNLSVRIAFQDTPNSWSLRTLSVRDREGLKVADIDGDNQLDIILNGFWWSSNNWRTGTVDEFVIDDVFYTQPVSGLNNSVKIGVGDIDGDGIDDVVITPAEGMKEYIAWYKMPVDPRTQPIVRNIIENNFGNAHQAEIGDIDLDGDLDIITGLAFGDSGVFVYRNNGDGTSWTKQTLSSTLGAYYGVLRDLGDDGDLDFIAPRAYSSSNQVYIYENLTVDDTPPPTPPAAPSSLSAVAAGETQINLSWTDNADNETSFLIERSVGGGAFVQIAAVAANVTGFSDTGLVANTSYSYRVRATNGIGDSADSNQASATTDADTSPPAIESVTAVTSTSVTVVFTEPVEAGSGVGGSEQISNYQVSGGVTVSAAQLGGDQRTVTLTTSALTAGISYTLSVSNVNDVAIPPNTIPSATQQSFGLSLRVTDGLVALYELEEGSGATVADTSGFGAPLDLLISDTNDVTWINGGLRVDAPTLISSGVSATKIHSASTASGELTIETWLTPTQLSYVGLPARVVTLSASTVDRNFTLGQGRSGGTSDQYTTRLRTTATSNNGTPPTATPPGSVTTDLTHVVYTRDASGNASFYVDAALSSSNTVGGNLSNWNSSYQLALANELTGDRPWLGELHLVAIYDRALTSIEVGQNFGAGANPTTMNVPPLAVDDFVNTDEDTLVAGNVTADNGGGADTDPDDPITVTEVNGLPFIAGTPAALPSGASLVMNADGTFSYDPSGQFENLSLGQSGADSFSYTIDDGQASSTATVFLTIAGRNDQPLAQDDSWTTDEDSSPLGGDLLLDNGSGIDFDVDAGDTISVTEINGNTYSPGTTLTLPSGARLTINPNGSFTYDTDGVFQSLDDGALGVDSFSYTIDDGQGQPNSTDAGNAVISINGLNDAPVAQDDTFTTDESTPLVSANLFADNGTGVDTDVDAGASISVTEVNGAAFLANTPFALPSGALLTLNSNGSFDYDPNGQFEDLGGGANATDSFTYTIDDGQGLANSTDSATVSITIDGVNDGPSLNLDVNNSGGSSPDYVALFNPSASTAIGIADVDLDLTDVDSPNLTSAAVTIINPVDGVGEWLAATPSGSISASHINYNAASAVLLISPPAGAPQADFEQVLRSVTYDNQAATPTTGIDRTVEFVVNDGLVDSEIRTTTVTVSNVTPGFTIDLDGDQSGTSFTTSFVEDGTGPIPIADSDVTIVAPHNVVSASITLSNPIDGVAEDLTVIASGLPPGITVDPASTTTAVILSSAGSPAADFQTAIRQVVYENRSDSPDTTDRIVLVTLEDIALGASNSAATTITITAANDPPSAADDLITVDEDGSLVGNVFLDNGNGADSDPDGSFVVTQVDGVAFTAGTPFALPSGALLTVSSNGDFTYDSNQQFEPLAINSTAADSFTYTIDDGSATATAVVSVTIDGRNDPPVAANDAFTTDEDTAFLGASLFADNGSGIDSDADIGDTLAVTMINGSAFNLGVPSPLPSGALLTIDSNGVFDYDPNGAFESLAPGVTTTDSFSYTVDDGRGQANSTDTATVVVTVIGVGDLPAVPSNLTALVGGESQIALAWSDNANNESGFKIERRTGSGAYVQIAVVGVDATSFVDAGLSPNTSYSYRVRATNTDGDSAYSNEASATTSDETVAPTITMVEVTSSTTVLVTFSEPVEAGGGVGGAERVTNYQISDGISVTAAALAGDQQTVTLTTSNLVSGTSYILTVSHINDLATPPNPILANTQTSFDYLSRVSDGLVALYELEEGSGTTIQDSSGFGSPLDLTIGDSGSVRWISGGLSVDSSVVISSGVAATKVHNSIIASGELTIEAWLTPTQLSYSQLPARIVSLSVDPGNRNVTLGQGVFGSSGDRFSTRLRTTATNNNGTPSTATPVGSVTTDLTHVVYVRDAVGNVQYYIDGAISSTASTPGSLANWNTSYPLLLANEITGDRPWLGEMHLVAIYDRALSTSEVDQNYDAGADSAGVPNTAPFAGDDSYTVVENQTLNIDASTGVLSNDTDLNRDPLEAVLVSDSGGELSLNPDGSFSYTPIADFVGQDVFTYLANDGIANSNVATVTIEVTAQPPVSAWTSSDIGNVNFAGSHSLINGVHTVQGGGADIWGKRDEFHYVSQPLSGDGEIVAQVASLSNTDEWAKAGVMIRESLDDNAKHAHMLIHAERGSSLDYRTATGGNTNKFWSNDGAQAPYWVRLVRSGNTFTGYQSADGANWIAAGSISISMANDVFIGLAVTAHDDAQLATAAFQNVEILPSTPTAPGLRSILPGGSEPSSGLSTSDEEPDDSFAEISSVRRTSFDDFFQVFGAANGDRLINLIGPLEMQSAPPRLKTEDSASPTLLADDDPLE